MRKIRTADQAYAAVKHAMKRHHPMTISYTRANGSDTVRTVEPYALTRNADGDWYVRAMDRTSGESRTWRLDRISAVTEHRTAFRVERPEPRSEASRVTAVRMDELAALLDGNPWNRVHGAPVRTTAPVRQAVAS